MNAAHPHLLLNYIPVILVLIACGLLVWTAYLGGQIRHTEIREALQVLPSPEDDNGEHNSRSHE